MAPDVEKVDGDPDLPERADAVIIGGGIVGTATAYFLAKKGLSVALVEKGHVAGEQSSRNWGWCRLQGRAIPELPLARESLRIWGRLDGELGAKTGFRQAGGLLVTKDPAEVAYWEKWTEAAREHQIPGRILTAAEVKDMVPATSAPWIAGWYSPTCGRAEPTRAAPALARGARKAGATIHQQCAARGLETTGGKVSGVVTERGIIATSKVLCAGGAWTSMFCRHHGVSFPQVGVFATAFRTTPGPQVSAGTIGSDGFSIRPCEDGGYLVAMRGRGRVELTPQSLLYAWKFLPMLLEQHKQVTFGVGRSFLRGPEAIAQWSKNSVSPFEKIRTFDPEPDPKLVERAMSGFLASYPSLSDLKVVQAWGGLIDSTPDAIPVISPVESLPGFYVAAGFSGHGFALGPGAGRLAADLIAEDAPVVDPAPFRHARMIDGSRISPARWN
jgi:glycine/D-amino acid oxidase-like deaminating enzyme